MATINTGNDRVLVIRISRGQIESVCDEHRSVYENTKGRFIKTVNDGQIFLDEHNRAVIAIRTVLIGRHNVTRYYNPTDAEIDNMLHSMFSDFNMTGFIK